MALAMVVIFVASLTLMYIFDSLNRLSTKCKNGTAPQDICSAFNGFTMNVLIVLLLIGGFVLIISATVFILIR